MSPATRNRPLVVGVDDSDEYCHALHWALDEALLRGCPVRAVTVWSVEPAHDFVWTAAQELRERHERRLAEIVARATKDRDTVPDLETEVVESAPAEALVELSRGAALLVVGRHRGQYLRKALLGSVSAACAKHATVPVVVVPPPLAPGESR